MKRIGNDNLQMKRINETKKLMIPSKLENILIHWKSFIALKYENSIREGRF